jgi:hypothetical protein
VTTLPTRLESLGLEEVEPWVVEDTHPNRARVREVGLAFRPIRPATLEEMQAMACPLLQVYDPGDPDELADAVHSLYERNKGVLVDPRDAWSDYVDPREAPLDQPLPYAVISRVRRYREWEARAAERAAAGEPPPKRRPDMPVRCTRVRNDGVRCWAWATEGDLCKSHGLRSYLAEDAGYQAMLARRRVAEALVDAVDTVIDLSQNAASEPVRLKASTELLDRGGVHSATDVNVTHAVEQSDPAAVVRERLAALAKRAAALEAPGGEGADGIVDGEVVSDDGQPEQAGD